LSLLDNKPGNRELEQTGRAQARVISSQLFPGCPPVTSRDVVVRVLIWLNFASRLFVAAVSITLCACALLNNPKPTDQTGVVKDGAWGKVYRSGYVEMVSVVGVEPTWRPHSAASIPAGDRSAWFYVYVCSEDPTRCFPVAQALIAFRVRAGHIYRPRAQEQVNGSNRFWVWMEDAGTGEVVSERVLGAPGA